MTRSKTEEYKFNKNLLDLSQNKTDINEAIKEWTRLDVLFNKQQKKKCEKNSIISKLSKKQDCKEKQKCICQRNIKGFILLVNETTDKQIYSGTTCILRFGFPKKERNSFVDKMFNDLGYTSIDPKNYSKNINDEISEYIKNFCENIIDNNNISVKEKIIECEKVLVDIKFLVKFFKNIKDTLVFIENVILSLKAIEETRVKREQELIIKKAEEERLQKEEDEQIRKEEEEVDRIEKEKEDLYIKENYKICNDCNEYSISKKSSYNICKDCCVKKKSNKKCVDCDVEFQNDKYWVKRCVYCYNRIKQKEAKEEQEKQKNIKQNVDNEIINKYNNDKLYKKNVDSMFPITRYDLLDTCKLYNKYEKKWYYKN